jgi:hypothetical protein
VSPSNALAPQMNSVCLRSTPRPRRRRFRRLSSFGRRSGPQGQFPIDDTTLQADPTRDVSPTRCVVGPPLRSLHPQERRLLWLQGPCGRGHTDRATAGLDCLTARAAEALRVSVDRGRQSANGRSCRIACADLSASGFTPTNDPDRDPGQALLDARPSASHAARGVDRRCYPRRRGS